MKKINVLAKQKIILGYEELSKKINAYRELGAKIVVTIGSWDILHIGHVRYLTRASEHGDILVVGVDSDRGIKLYKSADRPIIPQDERMEMVSFQQPVDFVTLIDDIDQTGAWQYELLKAIKFDAFVAVEGNSYTDEQKRIIQNLCKELVVVPRQAEDTSTTNIIQKIWKVQSADLNAKLQSVIDNHSKG